MEVSRFPVLVGLDLLDECDRMLFREEVRRSNLQYALIGGVIVMGS